MKKNIESCPLCLQLILIRLQRYNLNLVYKRGKDLFIEDTLSTAYDKNSDLDLPCLESNEIEAQICSVIGNLNINDSQLSIFVNRLNNDEELCIRKRNLRTWPCDKSKITRVFKHFWNVRHELSVCHDLIFKGNALVIPKTLQNEMLNRLHFTR